MPVLAAVPTGVFLLLGTVLMGAAAAWAGVMVGRLVTADRNDAARPSDLDRARRVALREGSKPYKWFEPLIDELTPFAARKFPRVVESLDKALPLVSPLPWAGAEFLATKMVEGALAFFAGAFLGAVLLGEEAAPVFGLLAAVVTPRVVVRGVLAKADEYRVAVRDRLPFVIDLMALMMASGATIRECLASALRENAGHPIGDELNRVWVLMDTGSSQAQALRAMADRVTEPDLTELVNTVVSAADRGFELRDVLQRMAEVLRVRRVQYLERESERAKVMITWPGLVVMVACLLIVTAVFVVPATGAR